MTENVMELKSITRVLPITVLTITPMKQIYNTENSTVASSVLFVLLKRSSLLAYHIEAN